VRPTDVPILAVVSLAAFLAGCASTADFGFPLDQADIENGKQAFVDFRCHQCHSVAGVGLPELAGDAPVQFRLGGGTSAGMSFAGLVTSIINPNHVISKNYLDEQRLAGKAPMESPMPVPPIDNMTVRQLIDIAAFLDSRYVLIGGDESGT